jgi:hypothetical protein
VNWLLMSVGQLIAVYVEEPLRMLHILVAVPSIRTGVNAESVG